MDSNFSQQLEEIIEQARTVPAERRYWLIRTQGGKLYDVFVKGEFVAIGYDEVSYFEIVKILSDDKSKKVKIDKLKKLVKKTFEKPKQKDSTSVLQEEEEKKNISLIANQIYLFLQEIKKGDIVMVPSKNSDRISLGEVVETQISDTSEFDRNTSGIEYLKRKKVRWIREIPRYSLDPYFYKLLQAHQAINNIDKYSDYVERNIGNFYIKDGYGNAILDVKTQEEINAFDLFKLGYYLLSMTEHYIQARNLDLDVSSVEVKINLNSEGKIQFKNLSPKTVWIVAIIVVAINGGGIKFKTSEFEFDMSTDGIVKNIIEYQNNSQDREMKDELIGILDSLKVESPNDAVTILRQLSSNKKTE